ncbi:MAG: L,D-transpeptidase family protein [Polyangiaceae bacterium]
MDHRRRWIVIACLLQAGLALGCAAPPVRPSPERLEPSTPTVVAPAIPAPQSPELPSIAPLPPVPPTPTAAQADLLAPLRPYTRVSADDALGGLARVAEARRAKLAVVQTLFEEAGVSYPPAELVLRGFKRERELEVWASSRDGEAMRPIAVYTICATSGVLGPKRQEGDGQVPEGYYRIAYLWPKSAFHLAMKVGYPNVSDRRLGHPTMPGSDIMIHGGCASIGCLAMSDERIQEIYVMAADVQGRSPITVHLYPTRDRAWLAQQPAWRDHGAFWDNLYEGFDMFEASHRPPTVQVDIRGAYRFTM